MIARGSTSSSNISDSESVIDYPLDQCCLQSVITSDVLPYNQIGQHFLPKVLRPTPSWESQLEKGTTHLWEVIHMAKVVVRSQHDAVRRPCRRVPGSYGIGFGEFFEDLDGVMGLCRLGTLHSRLAIQLAKATWCARGSRYQDRYNLLAKHRSQDSFRRAVQYHARLFMEHRAASELVMEHGVFDIWFDQACEYILTWPFSTRRLELIKNGRS